MVITTAKLETEYRGNMAYFKIGISTRLASWKDGNQTFQPGKL